MSILYDRADVSGSYFVIAGVAISVMMKALFASLNPSPSLSESVILHPSQTLSPLPAQVSLRSKSV